MMSERDLTSAVFKVALEGCDGEVEARREALWIAALTLLSGVLMTFDPFSRERLIRNLERDLRESLVTLPAEIERQRKKQSN